MTIDLNCDMGEGFDTDALIMPFISSANIACGGHAGDENTMRETIQLALEHGVAIGAHPSYPDREHFGRKEMELPLEEISLSIQSQIITLKKITEYSGAKLNHVKPHGALYNTAAKNKELAMTIVKAIKSIDPLLKVFGLPFSALQEACTLEGLVFYSEGFADRTYTKDGNLTPRSESNALIESTEQAIVQAINMIEKQLVTTTEGTTIKMPVQTICIHGDGSHAVSFATAIHNALKEKNILIKQ